MSQAQFIVHDATLAELVVPDAPAHCIANVTLEPGVVVDIGPTAQGVHFSFSQDDPHVTDGSWTLRTTSRAPFAAHHAGDEELARNYVAWAQGGTDETVARVLARLPAGRYFLTRTLRAFTTPRTVQLGNALAPRPANAAVLAGCDRDDSSMYVPAFGADASVAPSRGSTLLGVMLFAYGGVDDALACVLFEIAKSDLEAEGAPIVIVPARGSLVVDTLGPWRAHGESGALLTRWEQAGAAAAARALMAAAD